MTSDVSTAQDGAFSANQLKAARALLGWSQQDLAREARIAVSTVADFERGRRTPVPNNLDAMRGAVEKAGISLLPGGAIVGPPPPISATVKTAGTPIRWIDATDLMHWADRRDAQDTMPELLSRLIVAAKGSSARLRFPSGDSVQLPGWDGVCEVEAGTTYVPSGGSAWEIGTQREGIRAKADKDYEKRSKDPRGQDPSRTTFVFVTPRHWSEKDDWARERRAESTWAEIRAYDADDLVQWIELYPTVGHWLAVKMGKRPAGLRQLDEAWEEWSSSTKWPMAAGLVLAGRDEEATRTLRWLRGEPSVLVVQGESPDEAIAFLHAALHQLPPEYRLAYDVRCLVTATTDAARALGDSPSPLIIVLDGGEPGVAARLAQNGHHVYVAHGSDAGAPSDTQRLSRPPREEIEYALTEMGVERERARSLARESARSLAVLRRLIPLAPGQIQPAWAEEQHARELLPLLLAGAWDDGSEGDRTALERLAGKPYDTIVADLAPWVGVPDSPLRKVGTTWKIASPRDAWFLLARHVGPPHVDRLTEVAANVLGSPDPRFEMAADERWLSAIRGVQPHYSSLIRRGLTETLVLLSLFGDRAPSVTDPAARAGAVVRRLLEGADRCRWWSISRDFELLAEASPEAFLTALENCLEREDPPVKALFGEEGGPFGGEHLSSLLWALETLAWSTQYLGRVSLVLARMASLDPGGRFQNRPENSLRHIFLLWLPQTNASLDQRLHVLDRVRLIEPDAAWRLMLGILPRGHDAVTPSPLPRWRDFSADRPEEVTYRLIAKGAEELSNRILQDVGVDGGRWKQLIKILPNLAPDQRARAMELLSATACRLESGRVRSEVWTALRELLHLHRECQDSDWSLPVEDLDKIEQVYNALEPTDSIERAAWLFSDNPRLPRPTAEGWDANQEAAASLRRNFVTELLTNPRGDDAVFALARSVERPDLVGAALVEAAGDPALRDTILARAVTAGDRAEGAFGQGIVFASFRLGGEPWAGALLDRVAAEAWGADAAVRILTALPQSWWTWDRATRLGKDVEDLYWKTLNVPWLGGEVATITFAIEKLRAGGRARHAVEIAARSAGKGLPSALLADVLEQAVKELASDPNAVRDATMLRHSVETVLQHLDAAGDIREDRVARLEWALLPLLEHSRRPPIVLHRLLATSPDFFVEVLCALYRPSPDSGVADTPPLDSQRARAVAERAFDLLRTWRYLPGLDAGVLDAAALEAWVKQTRDLCAKAGRAAIGDEQIGQVLSSAPADPDGVWPATAVRDVIEITRSRHLETGILVGVRNSRGVTSRAPTDGGSQERALAQGYRAWSKATELQWPRTSALLEEIARSYEEDARRQDHDAERLEWS